MRGRIASDNREEQPRMADPSYKWRCVRDPSGFFEGRLFRKTDLEFGGFSHGTIFRNIKTKKIFHYKGVKK